MLANLDASADEGATLRAGRDLELVSTERDGIVMGNDACELEAQHIVGAQAIGDRLSRAGPPVS